VSSNPGPAVLIIIAAVTYVVGYSRARDAERQTATQDHQALQESMQIAAQLGTNQDASQKNTSANGPAANRDGTNTPGGAGSGVSPKPATPNPPSKWGPIESDPRKVGLNYFTLIHTGREGAVRVAAYCRQYGLEAYVVPVKNEVYRVFVAPGFPADDLASSEAAAVKQRIDEVRTRWRAQFGKDELDRFPQKHTG